MRATLDPVAIVNNRSTMGGPQPAKLARMLKAAQQRSADHAGWVEQKRARIDAALTTLDEDFDKLLRVAPAR